MEKKTKEGMEEEMKKKIIDHLHEFNMTQIINCFLRDLNKYYTKEEDKEEVGKNFAPAIIRNYPDRSIVSINRSLAVHRNTWNKC